MCCGSCVWPTALAGQTDVDCDEKPDQLLLLPDDGSDFIGLKLRNGKALHFSIIEPTTPCGCPFQPTMNWVPGDPLERRKLWPLNTCQESLLRNALLLLRGLAPPN